MRLRTIIAILTMISSVVLGLYVGLYLFFICGIVDIVNQVKSPPPVDSVVILLSCIRIFCSFIVGFIAWAALFVPGFAMLFGGSKKESNQTEKAVPSS